MTNGFEKPAVNPRDAVSIPALMLMIIAAMGIATALLYFAIPPIIRMLMQSPNLTDALRGQLEVALEDYAPWRGLPLLVAGALSFFGALQMRNLRGYGWAMAAAIINCIPLYGSCCCLGLPFGIWALVVLVKPEVKAAFRESA
jgi:hypothetical protein